jgi:hypothetical protein
MRCSSRSRRSTMVGWRGVQHGRCLLLWRLLLVQTVQGGDAVCCLLHRGGVHGYGGRHRDDEYVAACGSI